MPQQPPPRTGPTRLTHLARAVLVRTGLVVYALVAGLGVLTLSPEQDLLLLPAVAATCAAVCGALNRALQDLEDLGRLDVVRWTWRLTAVVPFIAATRLLGPGLSAALVGALCLLGVLELVGSSAGLGWLEAAGHEGRARGGGAARHAAGLRTRTLDTLVEEWERSQRELSAVRVRGLALTVRRAALLDELERRDPVGFSTWLFAGMASGYPLRAFVRDRASS